MTQQRGYFCGTRSIPRLFDPYHPIFVGNCDANVRYTCVARGEYPFALREAADCGKQGCDMKGGPDGPDGFDDCVA